uniref:Secreted protein n=1 Tax=Steinernema glaseri TaxID=37863 RepID=A0A1I7XW00_9BILA
MKLLPALLSCAFLATATQAYREYRESQDGPLAPEMPMAIVYGDGWMAGPDDEYGLGWKRGHFAPWDWVKDKALGLTDWVKEKYNRAFASPEEVAPAEKQTFKSGHFKPIGQESIRTPYNYPVEDSDEEYYDLPDEELDPEFGQIHPDYNDEREFKRGHFFGGIFKKIMKKLLTADLD